MIFQWEIIMNDDSVIIAVLIALLSWASVQDLKNRANTTEIILSAILAITIIVACGIFYRNNFSHKGKESKKVKNYIAEIPDCLKLESAHVVKLGIENDLKIPLYLPDHIRRRHVHILGATGSGKTESVILNFLKQDVKRGYGAIILDAKGDYSFLDELYKWVPTEKPRIRWKMGHRLFLLYFLSMNFAKTFLREKKCKQITIIVYHPSLRKWGEVERKYKIRLALIYFAGFEQVGIQYYFVYTFCRMAQICNEIFTIATYRNLAKHVVLFQGVNNRTRNKIPDFEFVLAPDYAMLIIGGQI